MIVGTRLLQQGLAALLEGHEDLTVVGGCGAGDAAAMAAERSPDIVLMSVRSDVRSTLASLAPLSNLRPRPRTILVAGELSRDEFAEATAKHAVDAWISEEEGSEQLFEALDAVRRSRRHVGPIIVDLLRTSGADSPERRAIDIGLTRRQREVLALIAQGKTEREIGRELGLSHRTVHAHRTSIMNKLGVHNAAALVRYAIRLGIATP